MADETIKGTLAVLFPMITSRLKQARDIAAAAESCAGSGNFEADFRVLLNVEQHTYEAGMFLNAASLIRRESEE